MVREVSSPNMYDSINGIVRDVTKSRQEINKVTAQVTSQQKHTSNADLARDGLVGKFVDLYKGIGENKNYVKGNETVGFRLSAVEQQLDNLFSDVTGALSDLTILRSSSRENVNVEQLVKDRLNNLKNTLNFRYENQAIFSGMDTDQDPVNDIINNSNLVDGTPTNNYLNETGVSQDSIFVNIDNNRKIQVNISAGEKAFAEIMGAYHMILEGQDDAGYDQLREGLESLSALRSDIANRMRVIEDTNENLDDNVNFLNSQYNDNFQIDMAEAMTQNAYLEASINALFMQISKIARLNLVDYLK